MQKLISVAVKDIIVYFRDPGAYIGTFLIPVIFALFLGLGLAGGGNGGGNFRVDVINNDVEGTLSTEFLNLVSSASDRILLCPQASPAEDDPCQLAETGELTAEAALTRLSNNVTNAYLEIPAGFSAALQAGEPMSIIFRTNANAGTQTLVSQAVNAAAVRLNGTVSAATIAVNTVNEVIPFTDDAARTAFQTGAFDRAAALWATRPFQVQMVAANVESSATVSGSQAGLGQSVPGMGSMFVMFTVLFAAITFIRERKNWTMQRLITMPVARWQILGGKVLSYFVIGMIQFLFLFGAGILFTNVFSRFNSSFTPLYLGRDPLALLLVMACFTLCMTALGLLLGTLIKTEMQGGAILNLVGLTLAPLGGAWWSLDIVPEFMRVVGHLSPVAWAMDAFRKLIFENATLLNILPELGILLAFTALFFALGVKRFKYD
jgi:ABC-2 type transport system permease protein